MKFATVKNDLKDGGLVLVSRDLSKVFSLAAIAPTMQHLLEHWKTLVPVIQPLYDALNRGELDDCIDFHSQQMMAPLPRAYQWCDASAFLNHGELVQQAFSLPPQDDFDTIPLMYQGASDCFLGANDPIELPDEGHGIDFEGEFAVVLDEVPMGCSPDQALSHVCLLMLANDVSLRGFIQREIKGGFGFLQAKPSSSFSPVAVTPDELGDHWRDGRVCLPLNIEWNSQWFGQAKGDEMNFSFGELIAHAALTRKLSAGTIIGSGTVSNKDTKRGSSCIAEKRALEMIATGQAYTEFMKFGDRIRMESFNESGESIFGAIDQVVIQRGNQLAK
jgi:fumarylacetoacetate (FAA) hydrolase